jgi:Phosphotransferase enzyme family
MDAEGTEAPAAAWQSPGGVVEELVLGTREEAAIDAAVDAFCRTHLAAAVGEVLFRATSVGVVYGVRLDDGRRVVVKAHQPRESAPVLEAVHRVQAHLRREGFPCPAPLVAPATLTNGLAVAEELVDAGDFRDTHEPAHRRLMAEALAWHLELTRACGQPAALAGGWSLYAPGPLWPRELHTPILDFEATAEGAEWIDAIAAKAKGRAAAPGELVVGHHDWSGKHFRFASDRVTVIYDWDSVGLGPEAVIVGNAAMTFTANFDLPGLTLAPTPDEVRAFVDEYSAARPTSLSRSEREQVAACATFIAAYTARCEHDGHAGDDPVDDPNSFTWALRTHGLEYLRP